MAEKITLTIGDQAPEFELMDQDGKVHRLNAYHGRWLLIYFYPKDDTPGCTKQACAIRDALPDFTHLDPDFVVLGISINTVKEHKKFAEKYGLPFALLADPDKSVVNTYGVWANKKFMGREYLGTLRTSFLINPDGRIAKIYTQVKPEKHAAEILIDLKALKSR